MFLPCPLYFFHIFTFHSLFQCKLFVRVFNVRDLIKNFCVLASRKACLFRNYLFNCLDFWNIFNLIVERGVSILVCVLYTLMMKLIASLT